MPPKYSSTTVEIFASYFAFFILLFILISICKSYKNKSNMKSPIQKNYNYNILKRPIYNNIKSTFEDRIHNMSSIYQPFRSDGRLI